MKIISWNIDGAKQILRKTNFNQLLWMWQADIYAFQETKLSAPDIRLKFPLFYAYWSFFDTADTPSPQSGTACFCKVKPRNVSYGIGDDSFDTEGRIITLEFDHFYFVNCYVPQSQDVVTGRNSMRSMERHDYRAKFDRLLRIYVCDLNKKKPVIMCGDFNASISKDDMSPNSSWQNGKDGFSKDANDQLKKLTKSGFTDSFRYLHPKETDCYTHWSIKDSDRDIGTGRRLDYIFVSDDLAEKISRADIHSNVYGSDHCPVYLNIDMSEPVVRNDVIFNLTYEDLLMREKTRVFYSALTDVDLTRAWNTVDWKNAKEHLRELQKEVAYACHDKNPDSVKNAQFKLVSSLDAKLLAVKSVTSRNARAGIDHVRWKTPDEKMHAALELSSKDYHAQAARLLEKRDSKGKMRRFHIDTFRDRAMQALYGYSLAPVAETWSDRKSFSNRKYRSAFDANYYICKLFSGEGAPEWAFKTDVQKCYESIDHDWIRKHIPLAENVLDEFLRAGYFLSDKYYDSDEGIGIGSRLSPYLANMVMDGLQDYIYERLNPGIRGVEPDYDNGCMIRFADDILVSARDEDTAIAIKQIVTDFMRERNLRLSSEKTEIIRVANGFDFLKRTYSKDGVYLTVSPSESATTAFRNKIDKLVTGYNGSQARLIDELNRKILGFVNMHKMTDAQAAFHDMDVYITLKLFELCKKRCPTWSKERIISEFWYEDDKGRLSYALKRSPQKHVLFMADAIMTHYFPVPLRLNPYIDYEEMDDYTKEREIENVSGEYKKIWMRQNGICEYCRRKILSDDDRELAEINPTETSIVGRMAYIHSRCRNLVIEYEDYEEPDYPREASSKNLTVTLSEEYVVSDVMNHPLYRFFRDSEKTTITLSFKKIGEIIGKPLSEIAYTREFWFDNAEDKLCKCWHANGYYVKRVSIEGRKSVTFFKFRSPDKIAKVKLPDILINGKVPIRMKYEIESMLKHIFEHNGIPWE